MIDTEVRRVSRQFLRSVKESGRSDFIAECPFHDAKDGRPFAISLENGMWICYSCGESGNLRTFLVKMGLTPDQVRKRLASLPPPLPASIRRKLMLKTTWDTLPEYILAAYRECPEEMLNLGFDMGLLDEHDIGYDRHHDRITFALRDFCGSLTGVSGRARRNWVEPRYKVYEKEFQSIVTGYEANSKLHVYGLDTVYPERYHGAFLELPFILVEGYKGCLWMRQMGFHHTVALQGSTMSQQQEWLISRLPGPYYVWLDWEPGKQFPDSKSRCAAVKIAERLRRSGQVFLLGYPEDSPEGTAPDDIREPTTIEHLVVNSKTLAQIAVEKQHHEFLQRL